MYPKSSDDDFDYRVTEFKTAVTPGVRQYAGFDPLTPVIQVWVKDQNGNLIELAVKHLEVYHSRDEAPEVRIQGHVPLDALSTNKEVEIGQAYNAGGIPPQVYLHCPRCAHLSEGHECSA